MEKPPKTAAEITFSVRDCSDFEQSLNQWLDGLRRISSRPELRARVKDAPPLLRSRLIDRGYCDASLAAYVDWLCTEAGIASPHWVHQDSRVAAFGPGETESLSPETLAATPPAFRKRNVFRVPQSVVRLRRGRPRKSEGEKRAKNAERQRRFRRRLKAKLARLEELEARQTT